MNDCDICKDKIITNKSEQWCRYYFNEPNFECSYFSSNELEDNE